MKIRTTFSKYSNKPWFITRHGFEAFKLSLDDPEFFIVDYKKQFEQLKSARPDFTVYGVQIERAQMLTDSVWSVPIKGPIIKGADMLDQLFGATSHENISEDIDTAINGGAETIVLDIDSPGGTVSGTPELGAKIQRLKDSGIQFASFTEGLAASAAVWIGSLGIEIAMTESANWGSVGVLYEHISWEQYLEENGIHVELITSGEHKAAGHPAKDLTESQAALFQDEIDELAGKFKDLVQLNRPAVREDDLQGQVFSADAAISKGFVDRKVDSFVDFISSIT